MGGLLETLVLAVVVASLGYVLPLPGDVDNLRLENDPDSSSPDGLFVGRAVGFMRGLTTAPGGIGTGRSSGDGKDVIVGEPERPMGGREGGGGGGLFVPLRSDEDEEERRL